MESYLQHQMDFLEACSAGNMERTTSMLESGLVDIEFRHRVNGWTGLHWAARRGHTDIVDLLLRAGFDPKAKSKQGKTPVDVAIEPSVKAILEEYSQSPSDESMEMNSASSGSPVKEKNNNDMEHGDMRPSSDETDAKEMLSNKEARTNSVDFAAAYSPGSPMTPTRKQELYSYGRRDSLDRTRFLLVRTNFADGKEAYRRITLPGGGTVEHLKLTVERSMRMGRVAQVILLPDRIPIETQEQIRNLADSQKVEVVFEPNDDIKDTKANRKGSLTEKTFSEAKTVKLRAARVQKTVSMNDDYMLNTNGDSQPKDTQLNTSLTLDEQVELGTGNTADVNTSQLSTHIAEAESILTDLSLRASSPFAEIATVVPTREVASSRLSESVNVPSDGSVEVLQDVREHEINEQTMEENISEEIALANRHSCNEDVHLTVVSASNVSVDAAEMECLLKEDIVEVLADYASKSGKVQKVLGALIGDENDKYRRLKIALLVTGVVGISGGIAYYLFVKVK
uniref:ANK_REP_REGION domain-containing protein n=1 Tax=Parascaris univalens TaxID=6257 RepID=A0A915BBF2_PARUN